MLGSEFRWDALRVYLNSDRADPATGLLVARIRATLARWPELRLVASPDLADVILQPLRPDRASGLADLRESDAEGVRATLPPSFADRPLELWALTAAELSMGPEFRVGLTGAALESALAALLGRLVDQLAGQRLAALAETAPALAPAEVRVQGYRLDRDCAGAQCLVVAGERYRSLPGQPLPLAALHRMAGPDGVRTGDLLRFELSNPGPLPVYLQLLRWDEGRGPEPLWPLPGGSDPGAARLDPGARAWMPPIAERPDQPGLLYIQALVSPAPLDLSGDSPGRLGTPGGDTGARVLRSGLGVLRVGRDARPVADAQVSRGVDRGTAMYDAPDSPPDGPDTRLQVLVHFATNRNRVDGATEAADTFGDQRGPLSLGRVQVSIPPNHRPGRLESPRLMRLETTPDPQRHVVIRATEVSDAEAFHGSLAETLGDLPGQRLVVYVHGFKDGFVKAARRLAQITFDLEAAGLDLVPVLFSWPSGNSISPIQYNIAWTNAEWAKVDLAEFLLRTRDRHPSAHIVLVAHSMGTNLLVRALERMDAERCARAEPLFAEVILAAPDIDVDTFRRAMSPPLRRLAGRTTIYTARRDLALRISQQVHGGFARLGDSSGRAVVVEDLDTVDVSDTDLSAIGHGYYAEVRAVLRDMVGVVSGLPSAARGLLPRLDPERRAYWALPKGDVHESGQRGTEKRSDGR